MFPLDNRPWPLHIWPPVPSLFSFFVWPGGCWDGRVMITLISLCTRQDRIYLHEWWFTNHPSGILLQTQKPHHHNWHQFQHEDVWGNKGGGRIWLDGEQNNNINDLPDTSPSTASWWEDTTVDEADLFCLADATSCWHLTEAKWPFSDCMGEAKKKGKKELDWIWIIGVYYELIWLHLNVRMCQHIESLI